MKNPLIAARVPEDLRDRLDRCAEAATSAAGLGARVVERGDVMRMLLIRALPAYEAELGFKPASATKTTKTPAKTPAKTRRKT